MLFWISWNPPREIFYLPIIHHPVTWYGAILAVGCGLGYYILSALYRHCFLHHFSPSHLSADGLQQRTQEFCEAISMYCLVGILLGARIGHILFYEPIREYLLHPLRIFMIWEGGISSHGAIVGATISIGCYLYRSQDTNKISFMQMTDLLAIPMTLGMTLVRFGNFINQEAVGICTFLPWAIIFENPLGVEGGIPRHPVQLYEAMGYVVLFYCLYKLYRKKISLLFPGKITILFLIICFTMRFCFEYLKEDPACYLHLNTGQWLSIPFILLGGLLFLRQKMVLRAKDE